jgi:hypothetical protein
VGARSEGGGTTVAFRLSGRHAFDVESIKLSGAENRLEEEIVHGDNDLPAAALRVQLALETLPAFLAAEDDVVLVHRPPSTTHLQRLQRAGLPLPEFVVLGGADLTGHPLTERTLGRLQPWGWSPAVARRLAPLGASWDPSHAARAGKSLGTQALRAALQERPAWMAEPWSIGTPCTTAAAVDAAVAAIHGRGHPDVVVKAEWGAAGRGAIRLLGGLGCSRNQERWLHRILSRQGQVVVEPWLSRVMDFSLHFDRSPSGAMKLVGGIRFVTDARGQYLGHFLGRFSDGLDREVIDILYGGGRDPQRWRRLSARVGQAVGSVLGDYVGPVGVDALVYRCRSSGALRIKPVVEINPRWSMGRVGLTLQKRVRPGVPAWFLLQGPAALQATEASGGALRLDRGGRWMEGVLRLTESGPITAVVTVGQATATEIG